LQHRAGTPDPRQEDAFRNDDVVAIVADLIAADDLRLVKLAQTVSLMQAPDPGDVSALISPTLLLDDELGAIAQRVADRAWAIATAPTLDDRRRRRGALLERLAHELVSKRLPGATFHEHAVALLLNPRSRRGWTHPKEVVATGPFFEVYECKNDGMVVLEDVDELSDVATTARAEHVDARATLVVGVTEGTMRIRANAWRLTETLYLVTLERILGLAKDEPQHELRVAP
jgi:hypothetical protein